MLRLLRSLHPPRAPLLLLAGALSLSAGPGRAEIVAIAPVQDRAGDPALVEVVEAAVREELATAHRLVDAVVFRDALRRSRIRVVDEASLDALDELAAATGADWVLSVTLHQSARDDPPRLALSGRAWDLPSGELRWAGFEAASGLDRRRVLGLGVVHEPDLLAAGAVERLAADLLEAGGSSGNRSVRGEPSAAGLGSVALVPLGSVTDSAGTNAAETATEMVRAQLHRHGAESVPSGCVISVLRRQSSLRWGGVPTRLRTMLRDECGARYVLTGQVEQYETRGSALEPEPRVALALRLVDTADGRIAWLGALERSGWDSETVFELGRIRTRGALAERVGETLLRRLLSELGATSSEKERTR